MISKWNQERLIEISTYVKYLTTYAREVLDAGGIEKTFNECEAKINQLKSKIKTLNTQEIDRWCGPDLSKKLIWI